MNKSNNDKKVGYILISLPILYNTITFLYCNISGIYNGDYLGVPIENNLLFALGYILSFIPFIILWQFYTAFKKRSKSVKIIIPNPKVVKPTFLTILIWQLLVTIFFGVNQLGEDAYNAPYLIKPIIQVMNRFPASIIGGLYIGLFCSRNKKSFVRISWLILLLGVSKKSLYAPINLFYLFLVYYSSDLIAWLKKWKIAVVLAIFILPVIVDFGYTLRDELRGDEHISLSSDKLIFGKLVGRLSSLSNLGFIIENTPLLYINSQELDSWYYQKQVLMVACGMKYAPDITPERMLFNVLGDDKPNISYMCSTPGNFMLAAYKSPNIFIVNLLTMLILYYIGFSLIARINMAQKFELLLLFYLVPTMSGVANEVALVTISLCMVTIFFKLFNGFGSHRHKYA